MSEFFDNFHFLRPPWLFAVLPMLAIWWFLFRGRDPRIGLADDISPHLLDKLVATPKDRPRIRPTTMLLPMGLVAVLCLAGPSYRRQPSPFAEDKSHLMLVVKMTPSMLTQDLQPSRLERTRTKVHDLLELRKGAATGLIAYSGSAHLVMPATVDSDVIDHMLEALEPAIMPAEGDALADALALAARASEKEATAGSLLVIADSVDPAQIAPIGKWREENKMTVQLIAAVRDDAAVKRSGIPEAAGVLGANYQRVTPDDQDIKAVASRADQAIVSGASGEAVQWQDEGYLLVPLLVLGVLLWCRRGWSVSID